MATRRLTSHKLLSVSVVTILLTLITGIISISYSYGRLEQKVDSMQANLDKRIDRLGIQSDRVEQAIQNHLQQSIR